jgi:hypothetical protein
MTVKRKQCSMPIEEAIELANKYVALKVGPNPSFGGEPCEYLLQGAYFAGDGTWTVEYNLNILGSVPCIVDGPLMVIVDPKTRKVCFFNERHR